MERHPEQPLTAKSSGEQIAWAAGLFEGEGFFRRTPVGRRVYLSIGIETRDLDVISNFVAILRSHGVVPAPRQHGPRYASRITLRRRNAKNPKHSDIYRWVTAGHTARIAYELMRPYLGERRRATADATVAELDKLNAELNAPRTCKECGAEFKAVPHGHNRMFCSALCRGRAFRRLPGKREAALERQRRYKERKKTRMSSGKPV